MTASSGTYDFQSVQVEILIRDAFENIGISGELLEPQKMEAARRSINLLLLEWINKSLNLWTLRKQYLALEQGVGSYNLPDELNDITQVNLRTSTRNLGGLAQSNKTTSYDNAGGGNASLAFDGIANEGCTQTEINGNISYDFGAQTVRNINFIGIKSNTSTDYTLVVEYSNDSINWHNLLVIAKMSFVNDKLEWFDVNKSVSARYFRVRETGDATLSMQEIYFNNDVLDLPISKVSRYEYLSYPNKKLMGRPSTHYLDHSIHNILYIWPVPDQNYNCIQYSYEKLMQDVGLYTNSVEIPSVLYPSLVWGLSFKLALKYNPQLTEMLRGEYEKSFSQASSQYSENITLSINKLE